MADNESLLSRRDFIRNVTLLGAGAAVGGLGVLAVQQADQPGKTSWQAVQTGDPERAVRVSDLDGDAVQLVTGAWNHRPAIVYKVKRSALDMAAKIRGRDTLAFAVDHPTEPDHMILAYDGKCTHLGCTVGWGPELGASRDVADYDGDGIKDGRVLCPCHQAQYDIHDLATHMEGTPAPRPLGVLKIRLQGEGDPEVWASLHIPQDYPGHALEAI